MDMHTERGVASNDSPLVRAILEIMQKSVFLFEEPSNCDLEVLQWQGQQKSFVNTFNSINIRRSVATHAGRLLTCSPS